MDRCHRVNQKNRVTLKPPRHTCPGCLPSKAIVVASLTSARKTLSRNSCVNANFGKGAISRFNGFFWKRDTWINPGSIITRLDAPNYREVIVKEAQDCSAVVLLPHTRASLFVIFCAKTFHDMRGGKKRLAEVLVAEKSAFKVKPS